MNYDEIIARAQYDALSEKASELTAQENKLDRLATKRAEKAQRLGLNVQDADLDKGTYTVLPGGRIESNSNKIWNKLNAIESQYVFGKVLSDYGLTQQADGNYTTFDGQPVSAYDARRLYLYGTGREGDPTTQLGTKLGLSTGQAPTSDVRYDRTLDPRFQDEFRTTDKHSVDLSRKQFDQPLDFRAATILEGLYHGNERLLDERMYPDVTSDEALERQSGVSEIYKGDVANLMGDASQQDLTPERMAELDAQIKEYMKLPEASSKYGTPDFAAIDEKILKERIANQTVGDEVAQTAKGFASGVVKGVIEVADAAQELTSMALTGLYNKASGQNVKHYDLIPEDFKKKAREGIDEVFGYEAELDADTQKKAQAELDSLGIKLNEPATWKKVLTAEGVSKLSDVGLMYLMNPSLTASSMSEIIGSGLGLGVGTKVAAKVGAKVAPKATEKIGNLLKSNRTKINEKYADKIKGATGEAKQALEKAAKKEYTALKQVTDILKGTVYTNADLMVRVNKDIEEYTNNNEGEGPDAAKLATIVGLNRIASSAEVGSMKLAFNPQGEIKKAIKNKLLNNVKETAKHMGKSIGTETLQEGFDGIVQVINQQHDSAKYEGKTVADLLGDNSTDIISGVLAGAAGGAHMSGAKVLPKTTAKVAGATLGKAGEIVSKSNQTRIKNAAIKAKTERDESLRSTLNQRDIKFEDFGEEQRVKGADTEIVKMNIDGQDQDVELFQEIDNLKVESNSVEEYQAKLEEHKDMVVQSLYTVNDKGEIDGLTEEAKAMNKEELVKRRQKVDAWLDKYAGEYRTDGKKELPELNPSVLDKVTVETIKSDNLTEEQKTELVLSSAIKTLESKELNELEQEFSNHNEAFQSEINAEIKEISEGVPNKFAARELNKFKGEDANYYIEQRLAEMNKKSPEDVIKDNEKEIEDLDETKDKDRIDELKDEVNKAKQEIQAKEEMKDSTVVDKVAEKGFGATVGKTDEEVRDFYFTRIKDAVTTVSEDGEVTYQEEWSKERVDKIAKSIVERRNEVLGTYKFDEDTEVDVDYEAIIAKNYPDKSANNKQQKTDSTEYNGEDIQRILEGEIKDVVAGKTLVETDSNLANRVIEKLSENDKILQQMGKLNRTINELLETEDAKKLIAKVFKEGKEDEAKVLLINALAAIDTATIVDTEQRMRILEDDPQYFKDEYYAGLTGLVTQIGKDHMASRKAKFKGSPLQITGEYRKLGQLAVDLLEMAKLVEINEGMQTVASSKLVTTNNENLVTSKGISGKILENIDWTREAKTDMKTGEKILTYGDKGIRLTNAENTDTRRNDKRIDYENLTGDVAKRINQLLLPGNVEMVTKEAETGPIKTDNRVSLYKDENVDVAETIQKMRDTKFEVKKNMYKYLEQVKAKLMSPTYDGNLDKMISNDSEFNLKELIGIDKLDTESQVLAANETGVSNTLKDELRHILDNLEQLKGGFHYDFQVDSNNRWTLRQVMVNYQSSKSIARQLVTLQDEGQGYEIGGDKELKSTVDSIALELGFKATNPDNVDAEYDLVTEYVTDKSIDRYSAEQLKKYVADKLGYEGKMLDDTVKQFTKIQMAMAIGTHAKGDMKLLIDDVIKHTKTGAALDKFGGKNKIKLTTLIDGLMEIRGSEGKRTSYMVERDAKASGVFNTLLNLIGFDSAGNKDIQTLLEKLGVKFEDTDLKSISIVDAYNLLQEKVVEVLGKGTEDIKDSVIEKELIESLDKIGIDTRELAKPPVMTWFYSAGQTTIVKEFTDTVLTNVVRKALEGDEIALEQINSITKSDMLKADVMKMEVGDANYTKLYEAYSQIGTMYQNQLENAFPGVSAAKELMSDTYNSIINYAFIDGVNYGTEGTIPSAAKALYGDVNSTTNKTGTSTLFKDKEYVVEVSKEDKKKWNIPELAPVFANKLMPNVSSVGPMQAQNIDIGQQGEGFRQLFSIITEGNVGGMSVHDAFYGPVKFGNVFKKGYETSTPILAMEYDFVNNLLIMGRDNLAAMKARLKVKQLDKDTKAQLEDNIKLLEKKLTKLEAENKVRMDYKREKLKNVETDVLGGLDRVVANQKETKHKPDAKTPKSSKTAINEFKEQLAKAKDGIVIDTETGLADTEAYQIGYMVNGEARSISILNKEVYTEETYYGEDRYNAMKKQLKSEGKPYGAKAISDALKEKFSQYTPMEVANQHRLGQVEGSTAVNSIEEALELILMEDGKITDKPLVGFNSAEFDLGKVLKKGVENEALLNKLSDPGNVDLRLLIKDLKINQIGQTLKAELGRGTQSDIAALAGLDATEYKLHDAEGDVKLLQDLVVKLDSMNEQQVKAFAESLRNLKSSAKKAKTSMLINNFQKNANKAAEKAVTDMITGLAGINNPDAKTLGELIKGKEIEWTYDVNSESKIDLLEDGSAKITIGKEVKNGPLEQQILEVVGHEVEHMVTVNKINELADGKGSKEDIAAYKFLDKVLDRVAKGEVKDKGRLARVMSAEDRTTQIKELIAVVRGEPNGSEKLIQEMEDAGFIKSVIDKTIKSIKDLIRSVRDSISKGEMKFPEGDVAYTTHNLIKAVEQIHQSSRMEESVGSTETNTFDTKQNKGTMTANEIALEAKKVLEECK